MSWVIVGCGVALGAAAGTVVPRAAYRLSVPADTPPRAGCVHCGGPFSPGRAGWVRPGAACRCRQGPGPRPVPTVLATGVAAGVLGWAGTSAGLPPAVLLPAAVLVAVLGVLLAVVDLGCLRLPDPLVGALAVLTVLPPAVVAVTAGEPGRLGRGALAAGLCGAAYLMVAMLPGGGLGFGDVKLAAVLGFPLGWIGWPAVLAGLILPHVINGPVALVLLASGRARRDTALPLGPALLAGALLAVAITV